MSEGIPFGLRQSSHPLGKRTTMSHTLDTGFLWPGRRGEAGKHFGHFRL